MSRADQRKTVEIVASTSMEEGLRHYTAPISQHEYPSEEFPLPHQSVGRALISFRVFVKV